MTQKGGRSCAFYLYVLFKLLQPLIQINSEGDPWLFFFFFAWISIEAESTVGDMILLLCLLKVWTNLPYWGLITQLWCHLLEAMFYHQHHPTSPSHVLRDCCLLTGRNRRPSQSDQLVTGCKQWCFAAVFFSTCSPNININPKSVFKSLPKPFLVLW